MKIYEAKRRALINRLAAFIIIGITSVFLFCSLLASLYNYSKETAPLLNVFGQLIRYFIELIYWHTQFASYFWNAAPIIDMHSWNTPGNFGFIFTALSWLIGCSFWGNATLLSSRIASTRKRVEEIRWENELLGQQNIAGGERPDLLQVNIAIDQQDQWYKKPMGMILIGVAIAVLAQLINLKFGLLA
jgi:hypothetical protein